MIYWNKYEGHEYKLVGKKEKNKIDNTIYTFDIETTSYLIFQNKQYNTIKYLELSDKEKEECLTYSTMYIWMLRNK